MGLRGTRPRLVFWDQRSRTVGAGRGAIDPDVWTSSADDLFQRSSTRPTATGPLVFVGHSMGGMSVMSLAAEHPELFGTRVLGVGFVGTSAGDLAEVTLGLPNVGVIRRIVPGAGAALALQVELVERIGRRGSAATSLSSSSRALVLRVRRPAIRGGVRRRR